MKASLDRYRVELKPNTNYHPLFLDFIRRNQIIAEKDVHPRLGNREKLFWVGEAIVSKKVVEDLKPILKLPDIKTISNWKYVLEKKLNINDSLVAKDYVPNKEMLSRIATSIRTKGQTHIPCGLSMDFVALNVQCRDEKNMMEATEGKYKGTMRPISHLCAYVLTPYNRFLPKFLLFAQCAWDGKARKKQFDTLLEIKESCREFSISI